MKAALAGSSFTVALDMRDVDQWASRWPCYGERSELCFTYDARNGDLIDVEGEAEGEEAPAAIANDACLAGAIALGLGDVLAMRSDYGDAEAVAAMLATQ